MCDEIQATAGGRRRNAACRRYYSLTPQLPCRCEHSARSGSDRGDEAIEREEVRMQAN